ncbi:MAG: signal peptide peptidase SppA [Bacteroidales bacterium]|nr:signal peptide peptidase SppA [Bacteroidales bacterium]
MKDFVKMTLAVVLGLFIAGLAMFFFSLMMIGSLAALGSSQPTMPKEAVLTVDMSTFVFSEQTQEPDPLASLQGGDSRSYLGILSAVRAVNAAAEDPAVKFMYLRPDGVAGGLSQLEEFRKALKNFRNSGKAIIALTETPTNGSYYLASVADKILMYDYAGGMNMITGLSTQMFFLKDILDKLGINVQLIRHGKYKSAGEMFIKNDISPDNRLQNEVMLKSIWSAWTKAISEDRDITEEEFNSLVDNLALNDPQDFLDNGLVDELMDKEGFKERLTGLYGAEKFDDIKTISIQDYAVLKNTPNIKAKEKIAIIYAEGNIIDGRGKEQIAGDRFASIIADVRKDSTVKAVVLRVNSPGGSVVASDKIKVELDLLRKDKPLIASYGNYAASGGYWISNNCDYIFSNATTLTGSIGVYSMIPDFSRTAKEIAHVNVVTIGSNRHGDMYSGMRPLDRAELAYMQKSVEDIYTRFTSIVAEGRDMTVEAVDEIAQGRVWAGSDALEIGLVDQIGTLEDAVSYAMASIGGSDLSAYQIAEYPKPLTTIEKLMESFGGNNASVLKGTPFEPVEKAFRDWNGSNSGQVYARLPYEFEFK